MLPPEIISKIPSTYEKALASGDLFSFPSSVHRHPESGIDYEIRLCPALQRKPHLPTPHFGEENLDDVTKAVEETSPKKSDPFAPPYTGLFVGYLRDEREDNEEYVVLMNKYSVVPEHFLLVTKEFRSQSSPPTPSDLVSAYALLVAASKARKNMIAFYNCGDLSGASQPHKHLQFIPLENDDAPIEVLARDIKLENADKPFSITKLPYANHVFRFPPRLASSKPEEVERVLTDAFISLLDLAISTIRHDADYPARKASYNVILSLEHMYVIPRKRETYTLSTTGGILSINSLGYAGMLLVKSEEELEAVKNEGIGKILRSIGLESVHDIQVAGVTNDHDEPRL
ncbi:5-p-4-tetraphosphate phosphorylase [Moniliophthora roreri MCA 2997]|uniref:5-p-4-tetraphosphate phosphorylase n=2 Tax=Moniliophthora roreri TaxID=221103 RepID=V2XBS9_MONRO|nr:5-p-4-tetraphosphate phosphorylase [Moniliophthora roreri MCA 2997]KAI3618644.1 5-p-4-tetraphosphate phosphorylase [Moniliophthora roreri]